MKKIRRKRKKKEENRSPRKILPVVTLDKPKKIKKYKTQKCAFINSDGLRCKKYAVGKSTLCREHGGNPIVRENLLKGKEEYALTHYNASKYDPAYHPISFLDHSRAGRSVVEIAAIFEVSVRTLEKWSEKYHSFNTVWEIGKAMHEKWWIDQAKDNLTNKRNFNSSLYKFVTMNKLGYSDRIEQKNMNMNMHGVLLVPDAVSEDEWEEENIKDVDFSNVDT